MTDSLVDQLRFQAAGIEATDRESPFGCQMVGEDVVRFAALLREAADRIETLEGGVQTYRAEYLGESHHGRELAARIETLEQENKRLDATLRQVWERSYDING
jgi:hypothetical protein